VCQRGVSTVSVRLSECVSGVLLHQQCCVSGGVSAGVNCVSVVLVVVLVCWYVSSVISVGKVRPEDQLELHCIFPHLQIGHLFNKC
jgi:hypothetical protein